jgi:hypothetical protein
VKLQAANQKAAAQNLAALSASGNLLTSFGQAGSLAAMSQPATSDGGGSCASADGEAIVNTIPSVALGSGASIHGGESLLDLKHDDNETKCH